MLRSGLLLAVLLVAAACGDEGSSDTSAPTSTAATTTTSAAATSQATTTTAPVPTTLPPGPLLQVQLVGFTTQQVNIKNFGDEPADLTGYWICQRPSYAALPELELEPGQILVLSLGSPPSENLPAGVVSAQIDDLGGLSAVGGEIALYSSREFGSSDAIVSYVEWGSPDHGRSGVAVDAGIWPMGGFVATSADSVGISTSSGIAWNPDDWIAQQG